MAQRNNFIDNVDLSESTSLTHLLDRHARDNDIDETNVIKHSPLIIVKHSLLTSCPKKQDCVYLT